MKTLSSLWLYCFEGIMLLLKNYLILKNKPHVLLQVRIQIDSRKTVTKAVYFYIFIASNFLWTEIFYFIMLRLRNTYF